MKRYIKASITSKVNEIVNNKKDVRSWVNDTGSLRSEEAVRYFVRDMNVDNLEITKYEPGDPDYEKYRAAYRSDFQDPLYVGRWTTYENYNATRNEELNALFKTIKTYDELQEFCDALYATGQGIWFYTKRKDNPLNSSFDPVPGEPDYVTYVVDRHDAVLKCKISNLYRVLTIK